jgi:hypothetical protein
MYAGAPQSWKEHVLPGLGWTVRNAGPSVIAGLLIGAPEGAIAGAAQQGAGKLSDGALKRMRINIPNRPLVNRLVLDLELRGEVLCDWCALAGETARRAVDSGESLHDIVQVPKTFSVCSDPQDEHSRMAAAQIALRALLSKHAPDLLREVEIACLARARREVCSPLAPHPLEARALIGIPTPAAFKARRVALARSRAAFSQAREHGLVEVDAALAHLSDKRRVVERERIGKDTVKLAQGVFRRMAQSIEHQHSHP